MVKLDRPVPPLPMDTGVPRVEEEMVTVLLTASVVRETLDPAIRVSLSELFPATTSDWPETEKVEKDFKLLTGLIREIVGV